MKVLEQPGVAGSRRARLVLPWDLSQWFDKALLLDWIQREVSALDWGNRELVAYLSAHPEFKPRQLLIVLAWSYATGVFESAEVVRAVMTEPILQRLWEGPLPSEAAVARFRRDNRGLLRWTLVHLFKRLIRTKYNLPENFFPPGLTRAMTEIATTRLDIARQMDRATSGF